MAHDIAAIRQKVRRLTRSPSNSQITNDEIDEYVNTFYLYDLPEELRLFSLKSTLSFYTQPNIDTYATNDPNVPGLADFKNKYITVDRPVYIAGIESYYSQSREEFYNFFPITSYRQTIGTGNGVNTNFSGTLQSPVLQNSISFVSKDANNTGIILEDLPIDNEEGDLVVPGTTAPLYGGVDYITGDYIFSFPTAPANGADVQAQSRPYVAALPTAVLYYDNKFVVRPVPDKPYKITMDAYIQPTAFLSENGNTTPVDPVLDQWWQLLAYGASKKIFEDRADADSIEQIMPELERQERLVIRRTLVQRSTQQAATIYNTPGNLNWNNNGYWGNYSGF